MQQYTGINPENSKFALKNSVYVFGEFAVFRSECAVFGFFCYSFPLESFFFPLLFSFSLCILGERRILAGADLAAGLT